MTAPSEADTAPAPRSTPSGGPKRWRRLASVWLRLFRRLIFQDLPPDEAAAVRHAVETEGVFSERYALMCALSAGIATLGLLQSSAAVVIGAMLVSPLMSPIAALGFGFASFDGNRIQAAARVVAIGAAIGIVLGMVLTWISPIRNATPEIIARTAPTLLDLAVALLSGIAGGYATVHRRGETAIGVAIATALMPPLATVGYSLAVWRFDFAAGATLLFLTNLAAIAFSFALVARLRGVARPLSRVEFKPAHVILGLIAFSVLAAPLALTLRRVTKEAVAAAAARREVAALFEVSASQIAQLDVTWRTLAAPDILVTVVTQRYVNEADSRLSERLSLSLRAEPEVTVTQIVATDVHAETQAMIEAALRNQTPAAGAASAPAPQPPLETIRAASLYPATAVWADPESSFVYLNIAPLSGVSLQDLRREEARLDGLFAPWRVRLTPPLQERIHIPFPLDSALPNYATQDAIADARWALERWNVRRIGLEGLAGRRPDATPETRELASARMVAVGQLLAMPALDMAAVVADREASQALYAQGGEARVSGVDIRVRAGVADAVP